MITGNRLVVRLTVWFWVALWSGSIGVAVAAPPKAPTLTSPVRLSQIPNGNLLVSDYLQQTIVVVDGRTLQPVKSFAVDGAPCAVAWGLGKIFVGNETLGTVQVYTPSGNLLYVLAPPGSIGLPNDIAVDEASELIYVLDAASRTIKVFALDGTFLYLLTPPNLLVNPVAMTFDAQRQIFLVSDFGPFSNSLFRRPQPLLRILARDGSVLRTVSGPFVRPQGAIVGGERLYLADSLEGEVVVFDFDSGTFIGKLGSYGTQPGQLSLPLDVVYDETAARLIVSDHRNGRITALPVGEVSP